jgi:hypothetical protein
VNNKLLGATNIIGYPNETSANSSSRALNAAATWQAFSFIAQGKTLSQVRLYQSSRTGLPNAADITLSLCANTTAGIPDATAIETRAATSIPATAGALNFTGFTTALTDGTQYWIVVKNLNATPATNFVTLQFSATQALQTGRYSSIFTARGWHAVATLNSGVAWATSGSARVGGPLIRYSDGTNDGAPMSASSAATSGTPIYGTRAVGCKFSGLISGITYNIKTVTFVVGKTGSPTSPLRCMIYDSSGSLIGTSASISASQIATNSTTMFEFETAIACPASNAPYRVVLDQTGGDVSNHYRFANHFSLDTSAEVLELGPMNGTWCHTSTLDDTAGTISWTDAINTWPPCTIALDSENPFTVSGGGSSGLLFVPNMEGM